jgi:hypothetical protein
MQPLLEEDTARARDKKSVILALRYFSATAGDALTGLSETNPHLIPPRQITALLAQPEVGGLLCRRRLCESAL